MTRIALLLMALAATATAQPPSPDATKAAVKKLEFLVGEWKGEGWMEFAPGRKEKFTSSEVVKPKAGGTVLAIEGMHHSDVAGKQAVVHDAYAVISYSAATKKFRFQGYTARGTTTDGEAVVTDGQLVWTMTIPKFGDVKYTIKLDDQGRWHEIGEVTSDGKTRQFFEMTLTKTAAK